jgi:hypothetical protein
MLRAAPLRTQRNIYLEEAKPTYHVETKVQK